MNTKKLVVVCALAVGMIAALGSTDKIEKLWAKYINGIRFADQYAGADASVKVNACMADVISAGGGVCDARGLGGTQTMTQPIAVGNTSGVTATLLVPNVGSWKWTTNIGAVCAVTLYNKSSIIGSGASGEGAAFSFQGLTGFSGNSVFCTGHASGIASDSYYRGEGFNVVLNGGTATVATTALQYGADSTRFQSINTAIYGGSTTPEGLLVDHMCCGASLLNVGVDAGTTASTGIHGAVFGTGNVDLTVVGGSFVHAGPGANDLLLQAGGNASVNFFGPYIEQASNADGVTPQIDHTGAATGDRYNFYGLSCLMQNLNTAYCLHQATGTAYMDVYGMLIRGEGATQYAINDELTGVQITTGAGGAVPPYSSVNAFGNAQTQNTVYYSSGGLLDKDFNLIMSSGKTVAANTAIIFRDRGANKWGIQKLTNNSIALVDTVSNSFQRLILNSGTNTVINSLGTNAVQINPSANSGTGGAEVWNGANTPVKVGGIDGTGLVYGNAGIKAGASGSTIADSRNLLQFTASLSTTAAASDAVTITGATASSRCTLAATNASAATNFATTFISAKAANSITVSHAATAGMTYDLACSVQ